jgi:leader peptidase (prepilin peptidase)/N-methyltransferase
MDIFFYGLLGWLAGVLVNYLSDVLPAKRALVAPVCIYCFEPQPVWNYLLWPRCCQECRRHRPWRVWIVEAGILLASLWLSQSPPDRLGYVLGMILIVYSGVVVVIDLEHRLILHPVSWAGAILGLIIGWRLHGWLITLMGGAVGFVIMLALYYLGDLFARWVSHRRGEALREVALGFGDVNLSGVIGLFLGWPGILVGLFLAIMLAGLVSLFYLLGMLVAGRYRTFAAIPYGPFLVASTLILIYFKEYLSSFLP